MAPYQLTRDAISTISDVEIAFGTTKLLPPFDEVPESFKRGNEYTRMLDCLFANVPLPDANVEFLEGFDDLDAPALLARVVQAHLRSFQPSHEHKIAGIGYLLSKACRITPNK